MPPVTGSKSGKIKSLLSNQLELLASTLSTGDVCFVDGRLGEAFYKIFTNYKGFMKVLADRLYMHFTSYLLWNTFLFCTPFMQSSKMYHVDISLLFSRIVQNVATRSADSPMHYFRGRKAFRMQYLRAMILSSAYMCIIFEAETPLECNNYKP